MFSMIKKSIKQKQISMSCQLHLFTR